MPVWSVKTPSLVLLLGHLGHEHTLIGHMLLVIYGQMRLLCLAKPLPCASLSWKHPQCGRLALTRTVPEVTSYDNPNTHSTSTGYPPAPFDHYDEITSVSPTNQKRTAQEAHRATRWRETSDFQFECADERKYPITYKKPRGQCPVCKQSVRMHTSTHDPILEPSNPNPKVIQSIDQDQTRDCSWFIQHDALTRHKKAKKASKKP